MTELQKAEFSILQRIVEICDELGLRYYLVCGSALGAAKYGGFIPWDDDVDVALPRPEYEIFCREAQNYLPEYYFLQNYRTDYNCPFFMSKVRDNRTTFVEKSIRSIDINHGVYVDVFPLDGYPKGILSQHRIEICKLFYSVRMATVFEGDEASRKVKIIKKAEQILKIKQDRRSLIEKTEIYLASFSTFDSKKMCNHCNWQGKLEYAPREQYGEGTWATFEGLKVRIPERYDEYLTQKYGDWRADLPLEEQVGHHFAEVVDLDRPYTDYIVKVKNGRIRLKTLEELKNDGITPPKDYQH